jgi:long-chain acyl-CoA synthetase
MRTLGDIPRKGAKLHAGKEAIVYEGVRLTYALFDFRINRLANALLGLGCRKSERIAILSENCHQFLEVYFAAAKAGLVVVPLNFRLRQNEIVQIVSDSEPTVFFVGPGYEDVAVAIKPFSPSIRTWVTFDGLPHSSSLHCYEDLIRGASDADPLVPVDENELAILMYTGGTTGLAKGVMLSHRNLLSLTLEAILKLQFSQDDTTCFLLPLFHVSFWPALCCLAVGGRVVILRRPEVEAVLQHIQDEKCTHVNAVPTLYNWLLDCPQIERFDLSSLRLVTYAGSPMPEEVLRRCIGKFGNILAQAYGLTEAAPVSFLMPGEHVPNGPRSRLLSSAGREGLTVEIRIVDDNGSPVSNGEVGEVTVRGANVMLGYWKNEQLTREKLRDGWLHTGDVGRLDAEGYLYLVDRKADMIITGGENVYPKETEDVLYQHPAVRECALVSAPDARWGERVQAVVVLRNDASATEEELISFCKSRLAGYKCPKKVVFQNTLPKSAVGKILRREIKKEFWKEKERSIG